MTRAIGRTQDQARETGDSRGPFIPGAYRARSSWQWVLSLNQAPVGPDRLAACAGSKVRDRSRGRGSLAFEARRRDKRRCSRNARQVRSRRPVDQESRHGGTASRSTGQRG